MRFGLMAFANDQGVGVVDVATAAERLGFESLWLGEHDHLPVDTVHPWIDGGRPPEVYRRFLNPFVALAAAASVTTTLRLGTSVSLIAEHPPLYLAKEVATLDLVSGGRVELGVGYGWNRGAMANNGVDPDRVRAVFAEKLTALRRLWTEEEVAFDGEHVRFSASWSFPKPVQRPHPPIILGAALTPTSRRHIVELADGWMPIRTMVSFDELAAGIRTLRSAFDEAGRDRSALQVTLLDFEGAMGGKRSVEAFVDRLPSPESLATYEEIGVDRCTYAVPAHDPALFAETIELLADRLSPRRD
jgi:probable F420-dependent oxidoreductase